MIGTTLAHYEILEKIGADGALSRATNGSLPNYPAFLQDRHFGVLQEREDFQRFLGELKERWKSFKAGLGEA